MTGNTNTTNQNNSLNSTQTQILVETIRTALDGIREGVKDTHRHESFDEDFQQLTMLCLAGIEQRPIEDIIHSLHADTLAEAKNPYKLEKFPTTKHQALLELEQHIKRKDPKIAAETLKVLQQEPSTNPVYLAEIQLFKEKLMQLRIGKDKNKPLPEGLRSYMLHLRKAYLGFPEQHAHSYGPAYPTFYLNVDIIDLSRFNDSAHPVSRATIQQWIPIITALYPIYEQELEEKDEEIKKLQTELKKHLQIEADKQKAIEYMVKDYNSRLLKTPDSKPVDDELAELRKKIETKKTEASAHKAEKERLEAELKAMQENQAVNNRKQQQEIEQLRQQLAESTKPDPANDPAALVVSLLPISQTDVNTTTPEKTKATKLFSGVFNFFGSSDEAVLYRQQLSWKYDYQCTSLKLKATPNDIKALIECGMHSYCLMKYEEALTHYENALKVNPKKANKEQVQALMGYVFLKQKKYHKAVEYFNRAFEVKTGFNGDRGDHARNLAGLGKTYICLADFKRAESCLEHALSLDPDCISACAFAGDLAFAKGNYQHALYCYERFLADKEYAYCHTFYSEICYHKGIAHRHLNDLSAASQWVGKAIKLDCSLKEAKAYYEEIQAIITHQHEKSDDIQTTNFAVR